MIKFKYPSPLSLTISLITLVGFSTSIQAQDIENSGNVYLGGVKYFFDEEHSQKNELGFLLGGEIPTSERWSFALEYWDIDSDYRGFTGSSDVSYARGGLNYHLNQFYNWQPYLSVGLGNLDIDSRAVANNSTDGTAIDFGAGIKRRISNNFLLRGDAKAIKVAGSDDLDYAISLSLGYVFGKKSEAPATVAAASAPLDTDNDGVIDSKDNCANTPAGRKVNSLGCQLDADRDGVVDAQDNCPSTSTNLAVDGKGCPILDVSMMRQALEVNFAFDESDIEPGYDSDIRKFAEFMREYSHTSVVIEGHTDSDGPDDYNQGLSERRANAVMNDLVNTYGIDASRLSAVGYGESRPAMNNSSAAGKAENRRIEAEVSVEVEEERLR